MLYKFLCYCIIQLYNSLRDLAVNVQLFLTGGLFVMEILKVSSHSSPNSVAGAIAGVIREQKAVEEKPTEEDKQQEDQENKE